MSIALALVLGGLVRLARPLKDRPVVYRGHNVQLVGYGVFAMLAAVTMILSTALYLSVKGQPLSASFIALIPLMGVLVWAGSRALHLVALGRKFWQQPLKYLTETGFYVQGGILGGMLAIAVVHAATDVDLLLLSDGLAWSAMLGLFFGRLGCFNYGCCYGREARDAACAVCYHNPEVKALRLRPELTGKALHPTQLYTAALNLTAFVVVGLLIPLALPDGLVGGLFLLYHGGVRLLMERFRGDVFFGEGRNWTTWRVAVAMTALGAAWLSLGPLLVENFGLRRPLLGSLSPWTLLQVTAAQPTLLVATGLLGVLILLGYGVHGRRLGSFPGAPQSRLPALERGER